MGISDSRSISEQIDQRFKSIRKYYDSVYGEITVVESKQTHKQFALVEKTVSANGVMPPNYIEDRLARPHPNLVPLIEHHCHETGLCSGIHYHFFLLEFSSHSLYHQIVERQERSKPFTIEQAVRLFSNYTSLTRHLRHLFARFGSISNHQILYEPDSSLKAIEAHIKNEPNFQDQPFEGFSETQAGDRYFYLSPQSQLALQRKDRGELKRIIAQENSLVFTLGMNFLECLLLADFSCLYTENGFFFESLPKILTEVELKYGDGIRMLLVQMTDRTPQRRPTLPQINEKLSYINIKPSRLKNSIWEPRLSSRNSNVV